MKRRYKSSFFTTRNILLILIVAVSIVLMIVLPVFAYFRFSLSGDPYQTLYGIAGMQIPVSNEMLAVLNLLAIPVAVLGLGLLAWTLYYYKLSLTTTWKRYLQRPLVVLAIVLLIVSTPITLWLGVNNKLTMSPEYYSQTGRPPAAPEGFQSGWVKVMVKDAFNGSELPSGTIQVSVLDYETENVTTTVYNGEMFHVDNASLGFIYVSGYNNLTFTIYARDNVSDPFVNTVFLWKLANTSDFNASFYKLDGSYGNFNASDLTVGHHELYMELSLTGDSYGTSYLGYGYYVPKSFRGTLGLANNCSTGGLYIGFAGAVENVTVFGINTTVYSLPSYNATVTLAVSTSVVLYIELDVISNVSSIAFFVDQIDNYYNPIFAI